MPTDTNGRLTIKDLRAGRNGVDPPQSLSETHCAEALNLDFFNATFGRKRNGVGSVTLTSSPFTGTISSAFRHVPTTDETAAELWAVDDAATPNIGRLAAGTAWATPTLKDVSTGNGWDVSMASLNGKLFLAYKSAQDRLHCWDPVSVSVRRTGLAVMAVPTIANTGAGAYAATIRYYRTRATEQRAGVTVRRSEYSTSASFTPSGGGTAARITQGTVPNEGETHWEVEGSTDNATFYRLATVAIGTTTYDDSADPTTYSTNTASATTGTYTLQKGYKFLAVDQGRLLGFGSWTATDAQNNVEFSAVLGSSNIGDDERVPTGNYIGLDENDSGVATALRGPINGSFFPGKYRQLWKMTPTGNSASPYNVVALSKVVGPLSQNAVAIGENEIGNAALYFQSFRGPYRYSTSGVEYLGKPLEDRILAGGATSTMNLAATKVVAHCQWYTDKRQVLIWFATGSSTDPDTVACFNVGRTNPYFGGYATEPNVPSGWSIWTGGIATARCSVLFSATMGATMSRDLKPYLGSTATVNTFGKCDTGTQDLGVNYRAYGVTKAYAPWGEAYDGSVAGASLTAKAAPGVTLQLSVIGDFGAQTSTDTVSLSAIGSETRVQPRFGSGMVAANLQTVQFQLGDAVAANTSWTVDDLTVTWTRGAPVVA